MKLQQIEYLNEIFNITFTLQQTLYLIKIAKKKNHQKSILNLWFFLFQNDNNSQEEIRTSMKIYKTAREILLNEIFDQSRNKLEKNRNADSKKKKKITEKQIFFYFTANNRNIWTIGNPRGG